MPASAQIARDEKEPRQPSLTVTGQADSSARPDRAVIQLGAVAQAENASDAQQQVNRVMQEAIKAIRDLGISEDAITTIGLSLHPVYADHRPIRPTDQPHEPRIVGYRASNRLRINVDDLAKVGDVIDAGVNAGANHVENLSFQLKDDTAARSQALRDASKQARAKADAIAAAMGLKIIEVMDVTEGGVHIMPHRMDFAQRGVAMMEAATPIQPGQVEVSATVTVTYRIGPE